VQTEPALNQQALPAPLAQAQPSPPQQDPPRVERAPREESPERAEAPETGGSIPSSAMDVRSLLPEAGARGPALQPQMTEAPAGGLEVGDPALPLVGVDLATRTAADGSAAAPAAPPGAGADQTGRSVAQQLVAAVLNSGDGGFEIRLSPEELGRVTLSLQVTDDSVVLSIQADRQDTLDLMRRNTDILLREFREAGFASLSFAFGQGSADGRPARVPGYSGTIEGRVHDTAAAAVPPATAGRAPSSARLDLRL
jgi:flagellar hook-length control protein FliK